MLYVFTSYQTTHLFFQFVNCDKLCLWLRCRYSSIDIKSNLHSESFTWRNQDWSYLSYLISSDFILHRSSQIFTPTVLIAVSEAREELEVKSDHALQWLDETDSWGSQDLSGSLRVKSSEKCADPWDLAGYLSIGSIARGEFWGPDLVPLEPYTSQVQPDDKAGWSQYESAKSASDSTAVSQHFPSGFFSLAFPLTLHVPMRWLWKILKGGWKPQESEDRLNVFDDAQNACAIITKYCPLDTNIYNYRCIHIYIEYYRNGNRILTMI